MLCCSAGYQVRGAEDVVGSSRVLLTGDEQYTMKIAPAAGESSKLTLSDVQKSSANIVDGPITPDNNSIAVFVIDKVLRSGEWRGCMLCTVCYALNNHLYVLG
jgi:hypothetical protein